MINQFLTQAAEPDDRLQFWLADTYETLPEQAIDEGTEPPIDNAWRSPFVGKSVEEAAEFVKNAPGGKGLDKSFFAVLEEGFYRDNGWVTVCRIDYDGGPVTAMGTGAKSSAKYLYGHYGEGWDVALQDWDTSFKPAMRDRD